MTTIYTCTEPKDAWALVSHFLGNQLLSIRLARTAIDDHPSDEITREENEAIISRARAQLIGNLYMLARNMNAHGHPDDASKIRQILDMVTDQDVTKEEVCSSIHGKNLEFNAGAREFIAAMAELRAKGAFQG